MTKTKAKQESKIDNFKVILTTSGTKYKEEGETILEAIDKMDLEWNDIKAKGVLEVSKGKLKSSKLFPAVKLRGIFGNKLNRTMWAKRLEFLIK